MLHYAPMASDQAKRDQYTVSPACGVRSTDVQAFAQGQVDYLMGNNPMNGEQSDKTICSPI